MRLRTDEEIGDGFVFVPAGPFLYGEGDRIAARTVADFAIQKYPVTFPAYLEFLGALDEEEARRRMPRTPGEGPLVERQPDGTWRILPVLLQGEAREWSIERYGPDFEQRLPVVGVCRDDADAYCRWRTSVTGVEWRIPTEEEREKATRGVDGRLFAWGDLEDASLGKCRYSRPMSIQCEPIGAFPTAESVYGMGPPISSSVSGVFIYSSSPVR